MLIGVVQSSEQLISHTELHISHVKIPITGVQDLSREGTHTRDSNKPTCIDLWYPFIPFGFWLDLPAHSWTWKLEAPEKYERMSITSCNVPFKCVTRVKTCLTCLTWGGFFLLCEQTMLSCNPKIRHIVFWCQDTSGQTTGLCGQICGWYDC